MLSGHSGQVVLSGLRDDDSVMNYRVRDAQGEPVSLSAVLQQRWTSRPSRLERYRQQAVLRLLAQPARGHGEKDAKAALERIAADLPQVKLVFGDNDVIRLLSRAIVSGRAD